MTTVVVTNLATRGMQPYTCAPRDAVVAAYAQSRRDWNTWQYSGRYGNLVTEGIYTVTCGDFSAYKDPESTHNQRMLTAWRENSFCA